ncbi:response regulator [Agarivorans sp. 1_MG-2023]|uniref:response regulator n=1 Tax=Agarivorans sp. 1_MG-2023 TaxID=3062634 RepID=UPI0026E2EE18|nr:response regulator [Agarivorans sp. 1_MG-2023]MDO6764778.1 response regulator [Agarivorans sp. 1_MG-2023]
MQQRDDNPLYGISILVVEDEVVFRQQLLAFLTQQGAMVGVVEDGLQALDAIAQQHYDIILMDLMMPRMNGVELLQRLDNYNGSVVVISGKSSMADLRKVLQLGACDFLVKPLTDFNELTHTILSNLSMADDHSLQMEFAEFDEHKVHFKTNDAQASLVLREILPEATQEVIGFFCHYRLKGQTLFPIIKQIDENHVGFLVVDICLLGDEGVVAAVIINGFFQDMWNRFLVNDPTALQPSEALSNLNRIIKAADLRAPVACLYGIIEHDQVLFANAGLLDAPAPFDTAHPGLALGLNAEAHYLESISKLSDIGFSLRFKNLADDRINLKLFPVS